MVFSSSRMSHLIFLFLVALISEIKSEAQSVKSSHGDSNASKSKLEIIRVIKPGVFDLQAHEYVIRMRAWGVSFPQRGQPGFEQAISFCEKMLLSTSPTFDVVRTFDENNLKVVKVGLQGGKLDFTLECVSKGVGGTTSKKPEGSTADLAQLKAKRSNLGVWNWLQLQK